MTTNRASIERSYADILAPDGGPDLSGIVSILDRDLKTAYVAEPPASVRTTIERLVDERRQAATRPGNSTGRSLPGRLVAWWRRLWATRRLAAVALATMVTLITAGCVAYGSRQIIRVVLPEQRMSPSAVNQVTALPDVPLMPFVRYRGIAPALAARQSGLPVAYLSTVPAELRGTVGTRVYPQTPWLTMDTKVVLKVHSLVRYRGSGHTLLIELSEPSPAVVARYRILLGEHTVHLANGRPAWTSVLPESYQPNVVSFVSGRYIVSAAADLSFARIEQLASTIVVSPEAANAAHRGIPATWPTPLPAATAILGVDIAMVGTADHYVSGSGKPGLQYQLQFGNRGMGQEQHETITLLLPRGIAFADRTPRDRYVFHIGGGNGGVGGTEDLIVTHRSAFNKGLTVRVTWMQHGVPGERTFHFPIVSGPAPTPFPKP